MAKISEIEDKIHRIEKTISEGEIATIPYIIHENSEIRHEKKEKRFFVVITLLIILLVGTNLGWLLYESQFEYATTTETYYEVDTGTGNGNAIINESGEVIINGESNKNS